MQNFFIGSLQILGAGVTNYLLQVPVDGLESADYRVTTYDKPGEDGAQVSAAFYSSRTITLPGLVRGDTPTLYEQNRKALSTACSINRDSNNHPILTKLSFISLAGNSYYVNVQFNKPQFGWRDVTWTKFQLTCIAPDPRIYTTQPVDSGAVTLPTPGGGFLVPALVPIVAGGSIGGGTILTNFGNEQSHPVITFTGPLTNPLIYNQTTGLGFQLNYSIPFGGTVVVDMYYQSVVYNNSSNFIAYRDQNNNNWLTCIPGPNNFVLTTASSADTGNVDIKFNPAWAGI